MSNIVLRQNDLFYGEDWTVVYNAFTNINFKNYSFDSIKTSLIEYIRINHPEAFTDWTDNSEFIMIIDLLAYLGETMSYRIDLNARDNFIDTAERKESILRLAKMISYTPKRNQPARGKVKLSYVKTGQIVIDSEGRNLQNQMIKWNDPQNPSWYEQFILVINSVLESTNPFGKPTKQVVKNNLPIQLYKLNTIPRRDITYPFTSAVSGEAMNFEIITSDLDEFGNFVERAPNPDDAKYLAYSNDGAGFSSPDTGFFLYFKQGQLAFQNYNFDKPVENRVIDIEVDNINEMDVWVSQINENGTVINQWTRVPSIDNIPYNSIDDDIRNIFSVTTRDNDRISIRFSDGKFGAVPRGLFRVWYRVSNGLEYTINPIEMLGKNITMAYRNNKNIDRDSVYDLAVVFSLNETVRNATKAETPEEIKSRAPRVYYTQNRMVNGEDYNAYPLSNGPLISKLKATNRVFSGQSPFFNNYDPTKRYSSTVEFGQDGIIYKEDYRKYTSETLPTNLTNRQIIDTCILPLLNQIDLQSFFIDRNRSIDVLSTGIKWKKVSGISTSSTGYFTINDINSVNIGAGQPAPLDLIEKNAYLLMTEPTPASPPAGFVAKFKWVKIVSVKNNGEYKEGQTTGPIVFDNYVNDSWIVSKVIVGFRQTFELPEIEAIEQQISNKNTFGLRYDTIFNRWIVVDELNVAPENSPWSDQFAGDTSDENKDASWYIRAQYSSNEYSFVVRLMRYVFESVDTTRFSFYEDFPGVDSLTNIVNRSKVTILELNKNIAGTGLLSSDYGFTVTENIRYADGFIEPRRIQIVPLDANKNGSYDFPVAFSEIVGNTKVFYRPVIDENSFESYIPTDKILEGVDLDELKAYDWVINVEGYIAGFANDTGKFYTWNKTLAELLPSTVQYKYYIGRNDLNYKYEHFSPENNRIDPAITNVIDMYVLTNAYETSVKEWKNTDRSTVFPEPEVAAVLQDTFSGMNEYKMISDQMIWNPAKFTKLFGSTADIELQAIFRVVKVESSPLTDNQIKQGVLDAIEEYFDLKNWNFGESIFTSEIIAYIHTKMIGHVASAIIVPKAKNEFGIRHPGDIYQIRLDFNRLPLNVATVDDISIIPSASKYNVVS